MGIFISHVITGSDVHRILQIYGISFVHFHFPPLSECVCGEGGGGGNFSKDWLARLLLLPDLAVCNNGICICICNDVCICICICCILPPSQPEGCLGQVRRGGHRARRSPATRWLGRGPSTEVAAPGDEDDDGDGTEIPV